MKKVNKLILCSVLCMALLVVGGCSKSSKKGTQEKEEVSIQKNEELWALVNEAFDKLRQKEFHFEGFTSEVAHVSYRFDYKADGSKDYDTSKIEAILGQTHYIGDVSSANKKEVIKTYGFDLERFDSDKMGFLELEEMPSSLENLSKDHTNSETNAHSTKIIEEEKATFVADCYEGDVKSTCEKVVSKDELRDVDKSFLNKFYYRNEGYPSFLSRGKSDARLIPDYYFDGILEEIETGKRIIFTVDKKSMKYNELIKSEYYRDMQTGTYSVIDSKGLKDTLQEAKIIIEINDRGMPISYYRYSYMNYAKQKTTVPYIVDFKFSIME